MYEGSRLVLPSSSGASDLSFCESLCADPSNVPCWNINKRNHEFLVNILKKKRTEKQIIKCSVYLVKFYYLPDFLHQ